MKRLALALSLAGLIVQPSLAEEAQPSQCGLFCKVWRNVSGHVQSPVPTGSWDDGNMTPPTIEEEARIPQPDELVVIHGEVVRKTRAERQRDQAAKADEIKWIDAIRADPAAPASATHETKRRHSGAAD